jgi:hypothetical protein
MITWRRNVIELRVRRLDDASCNFFAFGAVGALSIFFGKGTA